MWDIRVLHLLSSRELSSQWHRKRHFPPLWCSPRRPDTRQTYLLHRYYVVCSLNRWTAVNTPTQQMRKAKRCCSAAKTSALSAVLMGSPMTMSASCVPVTREYPVCRALLWATNNCLALLAAAFQNIRTSTKAFSVRCLDFDPPLSLITSPCFLLWLERKLCLWSRERSRELGEDLTQDRMLLLTKLKGFVWQVLPCREQQVT